MRHAICCLFLISFTAHPAHIPDYVSPTRISSFLRPHYRNTHTQKQPKSIILKQIKYIYSELAVFICLYVVYIYAQSVRRYCGNVNQAIFRMGMCSYSGIPYTSLLWASCSRATTFTPVILFVYV